MRRLFLLLGLLALSQPLFAVNLDGLVTKPNLWNLSQADFEKLPETRGFEWTSQAHDSARAGEQKLTLYGLPIVEVVARFANGKLVSITPVIYARGDVGGMPKDKFTALIASSRDALTSTTKVQPILRGKDATNAVRADGFLWQIASGQFLLEYSFTREVKTRDIPFRAEFLRLEITPPQQKTSLLANAGVSGNKRFNGPSHVKKDPASGDVVIPDVPMVDQGQKGYCAVACAERMMRYYGVQTDANEIAQIANSDAAGGTSADAMFDALKKLSTRLKVRVRPIEKVEVRQILGLVQDYNRAAKRGSRAAPIPDPGHMIDVAGIYRAMDPEILTEVRTKNKAEVTQFMNDIVKHIDTGVPLLWSVMLGIVNEKEIPQANGGHMRLIIGYNSKTQEIMYTDSWGAGHELKRMTAANGWTITTGLTALEPMSQ